MRIGILDYGAGNLQSVRNALQNLGYQTTWIKTANDLEQLAGAERDNEEPATLIFPGQGEFAACMDSLRERDLIDPLKKWIDDDHPYFGICLGYQALFESSEEAPDQPGLGILKGKVIRFTQEALTGKSSSPQTTRNDTAVAAERLTESRSEAKAKSRARQGRDKRGTTNGATAAHKIPHMGWNEINPTDPGDPLWSGLPERPHAYFVHSYYPAPTDDTVIATTTTYGELTFASSIRRGNLTATQFHPEKSQEVGQLILRNYLEGLEAPVATG